MDKVICKIWVREPQSCLKKVKTYVVPYQDKMTVLDALIYISEYLDTGLGVPRHHCKRGVCGDCILKVNGKPKLACRTLIDSKIVELEPQNDSRVLKDLLVDRRHTV